MTFYDSYFAGAHEDVWKRLGLLRTTNLSEGQLDDIKAVAIETMRRARANIEIIIGRLRSMNYRFTCEVVSRDLGFLNDINASANTWQPHSPPDDEAVQRLAQASRDAGAFPLTLSTWYEVVGSVNLMGTHPVLSPADGSVLSDPLVIIPVHDALGEVPDKSRRPIHLPIAPTAMQKAGFGTRGAITVCLDPEMIDPQIESASPVVTLSSYIRNSIINGGFPGLSGKRSPETDFLCRGLLPF